MEENADSAPTPDDKPPEGALPDGTSPEAEETVPVDELWVRYSVMRYRERFRTSVSGGVRRGEPVVLRTPRGVETGVVISEPGARFEDDPDTVGEILRRMTAEDQKRLEEIPGLVKGREFFFCRDKIDELQLPMKLIGVEHLFGGGKLIFYFVSDGRVDFRELVRVLAAEFRTRIEMKQVGVRDEARLSGTCNNCGRELCCRAFIREFKPITMKMAKNQKTTLDPSQLSGQCGRLKCCLRYEDDVYTELRRGLPRKKDRVTTPDGPGRVLSVEVILQKVVVELEDATGTIHAYPVSEIQRRRSGD